MEKLSRLSQDFLDTEKIDAVALGVVDFAASSFDSIQMENGDDFGPIFFDLASLSKPLTNSLGFFSSPDRISQDMSLALNHRAGIPAWGLLPKNGWQEIVASYPISESEALYSDFSALRFMLEFNKTGQETLHEVAGQSWDQEVVFWKDLPKDCRTVQNGFVKGRPNYRAVHDPNAFNLGVHVSHAGLFGTIEGVCKTLLSFDQKFSLLQAMERDVSKSEHRFVNGWDTVADPEKTLAGRGCGERTFGHLGFTGTSIWIDPVKKLGHVILCNATKMHWYDKKELNKFRKLIGELVWSKSHS